MDTFQDYINEYKMQLAHGAIQKAYKGLMVYMQELRTHLQKKYPDFIISGSIYYGYMDMTYFSFFPKSLSERALKVAIVFLHEACRFEVWLAGYNKQVQTKYWKLFKDSQWNRYHLVPTTKGADSILEHGLVSNPDFNDLDGLTNQIEASTLVFIKDVEEFLSIH